MIKHTYKTSSKPILTIKLPKYIYNQTNPSLKGENYNLFQGQSHMNNYPGAFPFWRASECCQAIKNRRAIQNGSNDTHINNMKFKPKIGSKIDH